MITEIQGFKLESTGGGCSALVLGGLKDERQVLIIEAGTEEAPKYLTDAVEVHFSDSGATFYYDTLEQALKMFVEEPQVNSEQGAEYKSKAGKNMFSNEERATIDKALRILWDNIKFGGCVLDSPDLIGDYLHLKLRPLEYEVFACMFLDTKLRLIQYVELFRGSVNSASVHPREVVKEAMRLNATAVVLVHNHPSGDNTPSQADRTLTSTLTSALALVEVRVLDHFIVGDSELYSFSKHGLI